MGGMWAEAHPKAATLLGSVPYFEIGNHSYEHPHPLEMSAAEFRADTIRTEQTLFSLTGRVPVLYRFPYEESDAKTEKIVGNDEAMKLFKREYRRPWTIEETV